MKLSLIFLLSILSIYLALSDGWLVKFESDQDTSTESIAIDVNGGVVVSVISSAVQMNITDSLLNSTQRNFGYSIVETLTIARFTSNGQFQWALKIHIPDVEYTFMDTDNSGNIFSVVSARSAKYFDVTSDVFPWEAISNNNGTAVMIAKYSPSGNFLWATKIDGNLADYSFGIVCDSGGNAIVVGDFVTSTRMYDTSSKTVPRKTISSSTFWGRYAAKYSPSGLLLWTVQMESRSGCFRTSLFADSQGNIYIPGSCRNVTTLYDSTSSSKSKRELYNTNGNVAFISKFSSVGEFIWAAKIYGNSRSDLATATAVDNDGNVFVAGGYASAVLNFCDASSDEISKGSLTKESQPMAYLAKYSPEGKFVWAVKASGVGEQDMAFLTIDYFGNTFLSGRFYNSFMNFWDVTSKNDPIETLYTTDSTSTFIAKYNSNGELIWVAQTSGFITESVVTDQKGSVFIPATVPEAFYLNVSTTSNHSVTLRLNPDKRTQSIALAVQLTSDGFYYSQCSSGYEPHENRTSCVPCPSGLSKNTVGYYRCLTCPTGAQCTPSSITCSPGFQSDSENITCIQCFDGTYKPKSGNYNCTHCPSNSLCSPIDFTCLPGFYPTLNSCQQCEKGYYKRNAGNFNCSVCPADSSCTSTEFQCSIGFQLTQDGQTCVKINEKPPDNTATSGFQDLIMYSSISVGVLSIVVLSAFILRFKIRQKFTAVNQSELPIILDTMMSTTSFSGHATKYDTTHVLSLPGYLTVTNGKDFRTLDRIAKGGFGGIHRTQVLSDELQSRISDDQIVAKLTTDCTPESFNQEVAMIHFLNQKHPSLFVKLYGFDPGERIMLLKLYTSGSLKSFLKSFKKQWSRTLCLNILRDIGSGLQAMHLEGFAHRDLKPENVLIDVRDGAYHAVLTDFGISTVLNEDLVKVKNFQVVSLRGLSPFYASPETFQVFRKEIPMDNGQFMLADIYSFGCIMYFCLNAKSPWQKA